MGSFVKSIFGGTDKSAQKAQIDQNAQDRALFERLAEQSSGAAQSLFGAADQNRNASLQQALSLLGGTIPQQLSLQQQGNVGAQGQLIGGLPMIQAALMGQPMNMGSLRPTQLSYNADFARQTLPQFTSSAQALTPPAQPQQPQQPQQPDLSSLLAQIQGGMYRG
jgi:hypothetical protein